MPDHGNIAIDRSRNTLRISRTYATTMDRVWHAWTDPDTIVKWWGPTGWVATVYEMDVRPGGRWRFRIAPEDGAAEPVRGIATYTHVDNHRTLGYDETFADQDWQPEGTDTFPTAVDFTPSVDSCRVVVTATFPDGPALERAVAAHMADGYDQTLARLDDHLSGKRGDTTTQTTTSADGTTIAYRKVGAGPAIIVISNVAEDHTAVAPLVDALAEDFTVLSFDRRGRGASGDPRPTIPRGRWTISPP